MRHDHKPPWKYPEKRTEQPFLTFLCGHHTIYYGHTEDVYRAKLLISSILCPECEDNLRRTLDE